MISRLKMVDNLVKILCLEYPEWRLGQTYFNALMFLDPEVANQIRGTDNDCFYNDKNIGDFKYKVWELWDFED